MFHPKYERKHTHTLNHAEAFDLKISGSHNLPKSFIVKISCPHGGRTGSKRQQKNNDLDTTRHDTSPPHTCQTYDWLFSTQLPNADTHCTGISN